MGKKKDERRKAQVQEARARPVEMLRSSPLYRRLLEDAVRTMQESQIPYRGIA